MADITIYNNTGLTIDVIAGPVPVDQSAEVAQLQADNAALTTQVATLTAEITAAKADLAKALADLG